MIMLVVTLYTFYGAWRNNQHHLLAAQRYPGDHAKRR